MERRVQGRPERRRRHAGPSAGALRCTPLSLAVARCVPLPTLTWILVSHQAPDIIGAVDRWLLYTPATVVCSKRWGRFVPHGVPHYPKQQGGDRYRLLPDAGGRIPMGDSHRQALPAHFLHSVGSVSVYDPVSRILVAGDVGSSMLPAQGEDAPCEDVSALLERMRGFHPRCMASNRVARLWADSVRQLAPAMIVP